MNGIARQTIVSRERADAGILDPTQSALLGCRPNRAFAIEAETCDMARAESICSAIRRADLAVLEIQHAAVLPECQPHAAGISNQIRGWLPPS
jgi:hypothetical protein